jgi:hypothetical protein
MTCWRNLTWTKLSPSRHQCQPMDILILIKEEQTLIKRYISPWLDLSFTFVHLGPILWLVCACVQDFKLVRKNVIWWLLREFFLYLVHTPNLGLWYPKGFTFKLLGYSDSHYASCKVNQKSNTGTCQFIDQSLVSRISKKQNSVTLSTVDGH